MHKLRARLCATTIRGQIAKIVLIPSVSFLLLWTAMSVTSGLEAASLARSTLDARDGAVGLMAVETELREERRASQVFLGSSTTAARAELTTRRTSTDTTLTEFDDSLSELFRHRDRTAPHGFPDFQAWSERLDEVRAEVDNASPRRATALRHYTSLLKALQSELATMIRGITDHGSLSESVLALELLYAREEYSHADALLAGALAAGEMSYEETVHFTHLTASSRDRLRQARHSMPRATRERYESMLADERWRRVEELSRDVVTRAPVAAEPRDGETPEWNADIPITAREWDTAMAGLSPSFDEMLDEQLALALEAAWGSARRELATTVGGSALALAAGLLAIVAAIGSSRRLSARLRRLRSDALNLADTKLPELVERVHRGHRVAVAEEMPGLRYGTDEIGQVADAFNTAQRTAVSAAVRHVEIREGANRVFLAIAHRNQSLIQRQLGLLDTIERETEDPRALRTLFRLDHLITRGRRYADNLIILSGARVARQWRHSMTVVDVLRGAISESENFERVRLRSAPHLSVRGAAVADVVHLVAELVENAVQFSPQETEIDVNCGAVANGVAVEVEDRGVGMTERAYATANRTLSSAPEFDVMALPEEPKLGMFVVARLAARHDIQVRLSPSPYGGTRAVVLLPPALFEDDEAEREYRLPPAVERVTAAGRSGREERGARASRPMVEDTHGR